MKKKNAEKSVLFYLLFVCLVLALTACGSDSDSGEETAVANHAQEIAEIEDRVAGVDAGRVSGDGAEKEQAVENAAGNTESNGDRTAGGESEDSGKTRILAEGSQNPDQRKLIRNLCLSAETKKFDETVADLQKQRETYGGYIETSQITGKKEEGNRSAYLVFRIPSEQLNSFLENIENGVTVTSISENTEDVTLSYVDVESHVKALRTEQESLLQLLAKAEKLSDILKIQTQLTNVRYEIETYESQMRTLDNQIAYSTVTLDLYEVERVTAQPDKKNFFQEAKAGLEESLYHIQTSMRGFAIGLIACMPYILFFAVLVLLVFLLLKRIERNGSVQKIEKKMHRNRSAEKKAEGKPQEEEKKKEEEKKPE